ncbi:MAG: phosphate ABC transporter permease subunit PstC [Candidatus Dormibacteraeota bacterium]|uniref:Phosphate transport system permease protein n=1 Tax=Candidatus Aeolococcus gillhamiae TaxID=3127015 RepID=A0A934JXN2_9BACT|nr:phosphate ABC transporter permease subunit PstC [Candidatus Dormibacteraeota bacterium]
MSAVDIRPAPAAPRGRQAIVPWLRGDGFFRLLVTACASLVLLLIAGMVAFLLVQGLDAMRHYGFFSFLTSTRWAPSEADPSQTSPNPYGILQFIYGTLITSLIGMLIAVPIAVSVALFITNFAPARVRRPLSSLVDLLAAVPSVVYGFWGIFALLPALKPVGNFLAGTLGKIPGVGVIFSGPFFGYSYFAAGIVLAIMVLPIITAVCREIFQTTPLAWKEGAVALGATRWEMVKVAVLKPSRGGIMGASILGLGRALGETIAVTMVIGNFVLGINKSVLSQGATMSSVIANEFTEATEPFHLSALFVVGFWLLVVALIVNVIARRIVNAQAAL